MPAARPEFIHLSESQVWAAIEDDSDPVAAEVTRLVAAFTILMIGSIDRSAPVPHAMFLVRAQWPIERVALLLTMSYAVASGSSVH